MPAKKPATEDDKKIAVRQEGRRGLLEIDDSIINEIGEEKLNSILELISFQKFTDIYYDSICDCRVMFGYCPMFIDLGEKERTPYYKMKIDLSESEPIIELFRREHE